MAAWLGRRPTAPPRTELALGVWVFTSDLDQRDATTAQRTYRVTGSW
ncbi:hypothetical protein [Streptomyces naphthomycinicus]|nr:hypothetical protein [Streptomyces sp. TML10]